MQKFILILFVGVLGVFVANQTEETPAVINDVVLENVEALAELENTGGDIRVQCVMSGNSECPISGVKVKYVIEGLSLGDDEETY
jgi:hypothetical protein